MNNQTPLHAKNMIWEAEFKTPEQKAQEAKEKAEREYLNDIRQTANDDYWFDRTVKRVEKMVNREIPHRAFEHYLPYAEMETTRLRAHLRITRPNDTEYYWSQLFQSERDLMEDDYQKHKARRIEEWGWTPKNPFDDELKIGAVDIVDFKKELRALKKTAPKRISINPPYGYYSFVKPVTLTPRYSGILLDNDDDNTPTGLVDYTRWVADERERLYIASVEIETEWLTNPNARKYKGILDIEDGGNAFLSVDIAQDLFVLRIDNFTYRIPYRRISLQPLP